jgi:hypothetical protein
MLYRLLLAFLAIATDPAQTGAEPHGGVPGVASAWEKDKTRLIEALQCRRTDTGWDYDACTRELRTRMLTRVCARRGPGRHAYYLQRGDGPRTRASVTCEE